MFRTTNPYDELIVKATDEKLTSEDWGLNLELCDKVTDDKEAGARNATSALQKRLAHRNPNVQIFALELTNTLSENCGSYIHQEIASKSFTEGLERVVTDRTTNDRVRKKVLFLIKKWTEAFENDSDLGIMGDLYERLKKNNEYASVLTGSTLNEAPPDDEVARNRAAAEEEEMQRAIELSKQDKGGRGSYQTTANTPAAQHSSSSSSRAPAGRQSPPARESSLPAIPRPTTPSLDQATRVRALYAYTPSNPTELQFLEGDVIKVIGRTYDQWWRGTLRGRVGIFPVNYVESEKVMSEEDMRRERDEEDEVFQGVARFDQLLEKLKGVDPSRGDRVEDSREIEELYATCIGMQAKIANLIQKYAGQKADLEQISNIFNEASHQYQIMKNPQAPPPQAHAQPPHHLPPQAQASQLPYAAGPEQHHPAAAAQQHQPQQHPAGGASPQHHTQHSSISSQSQAGQMSEEWRAYYAQQAAHAQGQAPNLVPGQQVNQRASSPGGGWPGQPPAQGQQQQQQQQDPYRQQQHQPPLQSQPSYDSQRQPSQGQPQQGYPGGAGVDVQVTAPSPVTRGSGSSHDGHGGGGGGPPYGGAGAGAGLERGQGSWQSGHSGAGSQGGGGYPQQHPQPYGGGGQQQYAAPPA